MTVEPDEPNGFGKVLAEWLDYIDSFFIRDEVPIPDRPFHAAIWFTEEAIMEIKGATKEDYVRQRWFHHLRRDIITWYEERYGARARPDPERNFRSGLLLLLGAAFTLRIPLDRKWPHSTGTMWFEMPSALRPGEDPFAWIHNPPNLGHLTAYEKRWLRKSATQVVRLTRSLRVDLMSVHPRPDEFNGFARAIQPCLERAVTGIVEGSASALCTAMWDLHLAIELALKAFISQRGVAVDKTHRLRALYATARTLGLPKLPASVINALPHADDSIQYRYGQSPPPSVSEAHCCYRVALLVTRHCTKSLGRQVLLGNNPAFLLRSLVAGPRGATDS